jgi:hypothetical protein
MAVPVGLLFDMGEPSPQQRLSFLLSNICIVQEIRDAVHDDQERCELFHVTGDMVDKRIELVGGEGSSDLDVRQHMVCITLPGASIPSDGIRVNGVAAVKEYYISIKLLHDLDHQHGTDGLHQGNRPGSMIHMGGEKTTEEPVNAMRTGVYSELGDSDGVFLP